MRTLSSPPSITPGDRDRRHHEGQVSAQNFAFEPTPPPMLDSGSDSGTEPLPQRYELGTQPEIASSEPSSSSAHGTGGGRGGRLNPREAVGEGSSKSGEGSSISNGGSSPGNKTSLPPHHL